MHLDLEQKSEAELAASLAARFGWPEPLAEEIASASLLAYRRGAIDQLSGGGPAWLLLRFAALKQTHVPQGVFQVLRAAYYSGFGAAAVP